MIRRNRLSLLLAAALLVGQALAAAHQGQHGIQASAHDCVACQFAHHAGAGALPAAPLVPQMPGALAPVETRAGAAAAAPHQDHPIRGPPDFLA